MGFRLIVEFVAKFNFEPADGIAWKLCNWVVVSVAFSSHQKLLAGDVVHLYLPQHL